MLLGSFPSLMFPPGLSVIVICLITLSQHVIQCGEIYLASSYSRAPEPSLKFSLNYFSFFQNIFSPIFCHPCFVPPSPFFPHIIILFFFLLFAQIIYLFNVSTTVSRFFDKKVQYSKLYNIIFFFSKLSSVILLYLITECHFFLRFYQQCTRDILLQYLVNVQSLCFFLGHCLFILYQFVLIPVLNYFEIDDLVVFQFIPKNYCFEVQSFINVFFDIFPLQITVKL